jgi:hypothetical protein
VVPVGGNRKGAVRDSSVAVHARRGLQSSRPQFSTAGVWYIQAMITETIDKPVSLDYLRRMAETGFGNLVKAVVDVERGIMAVGGELHADEEALLLERGSKQRDLWGINLYPDLSEDERIEFDSMINIRPTQGNRSRGVDDPQAREVIRLVVQSLIEE